MVMPSMIRKMTRSDVIERVMFMAVSVVEVE